MTKLVEATNIVKIIFSDHVLIGFLLFLGCSIRYLLNEPNNIFIIFIISILLLKEILKIIAIRLHLKLYSIIYCLIGISCSIISIHYLLFVYPSKLSIDIINKDPTIWINNQLVIIPLLCFIAYQMYYSIIIIISKNFIYNKREFKKELCDELNPHIKLSTRLYQISSIFVISLLSSANLSYKFEWNIFIVIIYNMIIISIMLYILFYKLYIIRNHRP